MTVETANEILTRIDEMARALHVIRDAEVAPTVRVCLYRAELEVIEARTRQWRELQDVAKTAGIGT